ncbi:hypothetical protein BT96DRAFT_490413 [Gymnopus androsaceus JB14]|uniref:F-box domain-containing protein n=1 Tax=Gymnopus androsaceus JB14 TaxID=1447944 RepID=A0A6A4I2L7_9AGAR|nr:hypothetical protein BT96DRAFT_490413 [Gymnopus androsaceus JB14]
MHHALSIAEILHLISTFCDPPTNAATALVCKQWSEESLNVLWYRVDDLENLLLLFGEMYTDDTGSYHFEDEIAHDTWHRFQNVYQHRIRSYTFGESSLFHHPLGSLRGSGCRDLFYPIFILSRGIFFPTMTLKLKNMAKFSWISP